MLDVLLYEYLDIIKNLPRTVKFEDWGGGGHAKIDSIELSQYGEIWVDRLESKIIIKYTYSAFPFIK